MKSKSILHMIYHHCLLKSVVYKVTLTALHSTEQICAQLCFQSAAASTDINTLKAFFLLQIITCAQLEGVTLHILVIRFVPVISAPL